MNKTQELVLLHRTWRKSFVDWHYHRTAITEQKELYHRKRFLLAQKDHKEIDLLKLNTEIP